jgi:aminoglycoside phosphotransferase (APT) family kinase protein
MNEQLLRVVEEATGVPYHAVRLTLRPPLEIQSNELYDLWVGDRHLIVKRFLKADEMAVAPLREFRALHLLAPYDIAPQPVFYDPTLGPMVVYAYLEGTMWDRKRPDPEQLTRLAQFWLTMQAVPTAGLWFSRNYERPASEIEAAFRQSFVQYAVWCAAHFPTGQTLAAQCLTLLDQAHGVFQQIISYSPPLCFCRADPRFANVIERPDGRLACVDWEDSGLRDPARDLADLLTHPNQEDLLTLAGWQPFLQPYLAARTPDDPTLAERMHLYLALFPLFWLSVCLPIGVKRATMGQITGWQINGLPANVRLQRCLARAKAWPAIDFADEFATLCHQRFFPE